MSTMLSPQQTSVHASFELIPAHRRDPAWLSQAAFTLTQAARQHSPQFLVSYRGIHEKLKKAPLLAVATVNGRVEAFVAGTLPVFLPRVGLLALYIQGVIVSPDLRGQGAVPELLATIGPKVDLYLLHTQNLIMARSLWNTGLGRFPAEDWRHQISEPLLEDLVEMLASIDRTPEISPLTGLAPKTYPHCLYSAWPLPGNGTHKSFQDDLGPADAVACLSFATERAARVGLDKIGGPR